MEKKLKPSDLFIGMKFNENGHSGYRIIFETIAQKVRGRRNAQRRGSASAVRDLADRHREPIESRPGFRLTATYPGVESVLCHRDGKGCGLYAQNRLPGRGAQTAQTSWVKSCS